MRLFDTKSDCCGCAVCESVCAKKAISMQMDENGFVYPVIDEARCVNCNMCVKVCPLNNECNLNKPKNAFAAVAENNELLSKSSSGGVFATLAEAILSDDGVVYGCSMECEDFYMHPKHIRVNDVNSLYKLQGSKYVQSDCTRIYPFVKKDVTDGKTVLFSGTPCQVQAVKNYVGNENIGNLITVDIVCHGVPSSDFFNSYLKNEERKLNSKIVDFKFRDKSNGWGLNGTYQYVDAKKCKHDKKFKERQSSYYSLFKNAAVYRESCYSCKFAKGKRTGDLTIGDYWGIEKAHPEYVSEQNGIDINKGISCVLVNTDNGKNILHEFGEKLVLRQSTVENVVKWNDQLQHPSPKDENREIVLKLYREYGYNAVDKYFYKSMGIKRYAYKIWDSIPKNIRDLIR